MMILTRKITIADHQRVLLFKNGQLEKVLTPGAHTISRNDNKWRVEYYDITAIKFERAKAKFLLKNYHALLSDYLEHYEVADRQVGLLYCDNKLTEVLAPRTELIVWKNVEDIRVELIDISASMAVSNQVLSVLTRGKSATKIANTADAIQYVEVPDEHVGFLALNGKLHEVLTPGSYGYWKYDNNIHTSLIDLRLQSVEVSGQEILTKDRVSLRVNVIGSYKVVDAKVMATKLSNVNDFIYREIQLCLREVIGTRTLDELLADKNALSEALAQGVSQHFLSYGIELRNVGIKDIILPGDMKVILNQVVEAQKAAEANLIKRREETQAMRSLHNTAKMMENNPVLLRLKELEALERVTEKIDNLSVYDGLQGVMNNLVSLNVAK